MPKSFIAVSVLVIMVSACNQPINVTTLPTETPLFAQPMASATPTALFDRTNVQMTETPLIVTATGDSACAAPVTRVAIGDKVLVTVEDWDKLKLRSEPKVSSDNVLIELDQYSQLKILEGPICVYADETGYSYYFWQVVVTSTGETGWVAEGDYTHYFIEKY
ncbi:MAG: hypothetical protein ACM33V_08870 [Chloroflexota bacterium]